MPAIDEDMGIPGLAAFHRCREACGTGCRGDCKQGRRPCSPPPLDLDREPGPQRSLASDRAHRFADLFCITVAAIAIVAVLVHATFSNGS